MCENIFMEYFEISPNDLASQIVSLTSDQGLCLFMITSASGSLKTIGNADILPTNKDWF